MKCEVDNTLWWSALPQREVRSEAEHEPLVAAVKTRYVGYSNRKKIILQYLDNNQLG